MSLPINIPASELMDLEVLDHFFDKQPKFNPLIAEGFAYHQAKQAPDWIANYFKEAAKGSFPPTIIFEGYHIATPEEAQKQMVQKRRAKQFYDVSNSDVYLTMYRFSYQGKRLPIDIPILLPNPRPGGIIMLRDSWYHITPVLGDIAISVGPDDLFVQSKMKLKIQRLFHQIMINDERRSCNVIWSQINNSKEKKVKSTLMHYLLIKYGLEGTFKKYIPNVEIVYGSSETVNRNDYPGSKWIHVATAVSAWQTKGKKQFPQLRTDIRFAVKREHWNETVEGMLCSFYYVADHYCREVNSKSDLNDVYIWQMILGDILARGRNDGAGKIIAYIRTHIESLDNYMITSLRRSLRHEGVIVDTIYDLFADFIGTFSSRVAISSDKMSTMYDKCYIVLRYILADIIAGINNMTFDFQRQGTDITEADVVKCFKDHIRPNAIMDLTKPTHPEVTSFASVTDLLLYKASMPTIRQLNLSSGSRPKELSFGPADVLHASIAEIGQPFINPSKDPTSRQRANQYAIVSSDGIIGRHEDLVDIVNEAQRIISR